MTCKNRLWQLRETLPENLARVQADGNAEIVLINYNSDDELDEWVRRYREQIDCGLLRYLHERTARFIHLPKAKNLAHLGATGEFLVNLDGDNFIGDTIQTWRALWTACHDTLIHGFCAETDAFCVGARDGKPADGNGTYGRIGLPRSHFIALGGYDEEMPPASQEDVDFIDRARARGINIVRSPQSGRAAICNSIEERLQYCGSRLAWQDMRKIAEQRRRENLELGRITVNRGRSPVKVLLNFTEEIEL
ncbi:glycosyltransferase family A protein [Streptomyces sp. NPDC001851]|uniref:glycosyltransferase n=1 Tax=Streptomyces sp. NPDC001851 TaxID=3154529 RepID=UPI003327C476